MRIKRKGPYYLVSRTAWRSPECSALRAEHRCNYIDLCDYADQLNRDGQLPKDKRLIQEYLGYGRMRETDRTLERLATAGLLSYDKLTQIYRIVRYPNSISDAYQALETHTEQSTDNNQLLVDDQIITSFDDL